MDPRRPRAAAAIMVAFVRRSGPHSFQVLRCLWVVEQTLYWLMRYRRLIARHCELTTANAEAIRSTRSPS